ncbi:MAG: 3-dehydroquinate synthase [Candidatus Aminicenantes bacterium]|nr:3-dehydroquinate synthase [Candidatus Aminicenantes bacterium]
MKIIEIHGQTGASTIAVGESLENLKKYLPKRKTVIITDKNVNRLYAGQFPSLPKIVIGTGEKIKTLQTIEYIFDKLLQLEIDRSSYILGIGGGIVCDITGFAASTYMRGVGFGFVSSTLLSQVDASVGGKNGVNFRGYKNMVGVFNQPDFVICDPAMLKTLPKKELANGFAEIVKHACLSSGDLFDFLENNYEAALTLDPAAIEKLVYDSVAIKSAVVNRDEKEKGERRKLNFGHTLGHALEKTRGLSHGEAVSAGMVFAAGLSVRKGLLEEAAAVRLKQLLEKFNLPTKIDPAKNAPGGILPGGEMDKILDALKKDKKREGAGIHFVLLKSPGEVVIEEIPISELAEVIHDMY